MRASYERLVRWLCGEAFPLWADRGLDPVSRGFVERLSPDGTPIHDPQRARVVGRQIYAYALAPGFGWHGPAAALVRYGLARLDNGFWTGDGLVRSVVARDGHVLRPDFDLYDHAFVLFGLAAAAAADPALTERLSCRAMASVARIRASFRHPRAGFVEPAPPGAPLLANPHMHMLEAALAWLAVVPDPLWQRLADEIAELCLERFLDPATGALRERFDPDWSVLEGEAQGDLEPGHQYEWAALLVRWGRLTDRPDALAAAGRLIAFAEDHGIDPRRKLAVNGLDPRTLRHTDRRARLWPQSERIKAHLAIASLGGSAASGALSRAAEATEGLLLYARHPVPGAWWEHLDEGGAPIREPSRASSLYHIVCAANELRIALAPDMAADRGALVSDLL
nr:AGE family epimerase/isomerase [Prosthecomicrobium pneumaticum]